MRVRQIVSGLVAAAFLFIPSTLLAQIQLTPVVSGLASPVFVGNAGDGSNRLFIVEQAGIIKVLQPGSTTPTVFLDIRTKVLSGGERGLLGLAFHPNYPMDRRFFVYYTRVGDGALVIAEYKVSTLNAEVADPTETVYLTILHPTNANHNGGMLAFGPDNFLYIGVGDGGAANDPPNNAQNIDVLLGKILRIDVGPAGANQYSSPASNFFFGPTAGRDEIFAFGWRNPWRFSFDRLTGQLWVGDVGQGAREEVDTGIVNGGNYGWRVMEGSICNPNLTGPCVPGNYIPPTFDYEHSGGRCSLTGGYVYRGSMGALPAGTYIYGDYCSGEILTWDGSAQSVALDTTLNVSSFGEDDQGELYVVALGGAIYKVTSTTPCTYSINPLSRTHTSASGSGTVDVTAGTGCMWTAVSNATFLHVTSGTPGTSNGTVGYSVDLNTGVQRTGTVTIAGQTFTVTQSAAPAPCTYSIAPPSADFSRTGGSGSVQVTTGAGCPWTAVSNVTWITITGGANGSGPVTYSVAPYGGPPKKRNGAMTIAGMTFSVQQTK